MGQIKAGGCMRVEGGGGVSETPYKEVKQKREGKQRF